MKRKGKPKDLEFSVESSEAKDCVLTKLDPNMPH